jgi:glycosyltransferase involved in cell wall biosynthesis
MGGAERVLKQMHTMWPDAPIYTMFADARTLREHFPNADIRTSWMQRIPGIARIYPWLALAMPAAIESFDLSAFDTVLSSSVLFSKGIIVRPGTRHFCYCYSPSRMLWDRAATYEKKGIFSRLTRHALRTWDTEAARRPDQFIAISQTVASRISKYYRRDSIVIPPPIVTPESSGEGGGSHDYFLVVARPVPHKNLDIIKEAFSKLRYRLIIASGVSDQERDRLYASCRAVIIANEEDFGLTAVEAMAHGKPVLALRKGGATETVLEGITGEFFDDPIPAALADGIRRLLRGSYNSRDIQKHATQWSSDIFEKRLHALIQ